MHVLPANDEAVRGNLEALVERVLGWIEHLKSKQPNPDGQRWRMLLNVHHVEVAQNRLCLQLKRSVEFDHRFIKSSRHLRKAPAFGFRGISPAAVLHPDSLEIDSPREPGGV